MKLWERYQEGHEIKDFLVRAWREAIYGNNDLEALL